MRRGIVLSLILSAVTTLALRAQVREVSGVVTDSSNSETLIGATVVVEGSGVSAITDFDGRYLIKAQPGDRLSFSCLGMVPKTVTLGDVTVLNVALDVNRDLLEEVIVVAYGTTKKESFTGSAEVVKADKFKDRAVTDVSKMLDGQVAGVMVTSGSGQPGSGADLRVRGYGSINASNAPCSWWTACRTTVTSAPSTATTSRPCQSSRTLPPALSTARAEPMESS